MNKEEKVAYWLDIADYDMDTAQAMYGTGRWLYVGFMCHQVVENVLNKNTCREVIEQTNELQLWIRKQLSI